MPIYDEYQIVINEGQRKVIMRALTNAMANDRLLSKGVRLVVQPKMNTCSLFACSAPSNRLCAKQLSDFQYQAAGGGWPVHGYTMAAIRGQDQSDSEAAPALGAVRCGSRKCQLFRQPHESSDLGVAMLLSSTRVRRDRTSIAFVPSRCDVTIDFFRETQLRRRGGALPLNPRPLGRLDRYSRIDLTAS